MNNFTIYFTFTYLHLGKSFYTPQYVFDNNFAGMDIKYSYLCGDYKKDSRHLAKIEYTGDLTEAQIVELLGERLALYGFHTKTVEKALDFGKYITSNQDFSL